MKLTKTPLAVDTSSARSWLLASSMNSRPPGRTWDERNTHIHALINLRTQALTANTTHTHAHALTHSLTHPLTHSHPHSTLPTTPDAARRLPVTCTRTEEGGVRV